MFLEPRIPEDWVPVTDKKLHDLIQMTGECASFNEDECPIYWDPDTEGYIFLHREAFGEDEVMAAYRVARQPNDNQAEVGPHGPGLLPAVQPAHLQGRGRRGVHAGPGSGHA